MQIFAHSTSSGLQSGWEPLDHHLNASAHALLHSLRLSVRQTWCGRWDNYTTLENAQQAYQRYIRQAERKDGMRGPDHSTAGAIELVAAYGTEIGRLMAFGVAGHHGGLMDGEALTVRLAKVVEDYAGWQAHGGALPTRQEVVTVIPALVRNGIDASFTVAFLARMAFSCLVDADFLETEGFYARARGDEAPARGGTVEQRHLDLVRAYMAKRRRIDTEVNRLRSAILDHANRKAKLPPGLFTLTVPTGGGKTLTSLSFALEHALAHGLRRVIYVIPFNSIIEQTAAVFREEVGLGGEAVLEHHSSFDWDRERAPPGDDAEGEGAQGLAKLRRDAENWDAPIVVTTAVQFFESLFARRTSQSRKLHNVAKSVIILDEAQSIPVHLLRPCMAAIDELAKNYGASVILCTATQPALRLQDGALPARPKGGPDGLDIPAERELAPDPPALYEKLRRVEVEWRREPVDDAQIAARFAAQPQMLCIVNSRAHARDLFALLREQGQEGAVHLSTLMCARHRRAVLSEVRQRLLLGTPVRLVSTSLIEAGVDVDFPEVWRAAAGLQNIAQAAGRCNREGRSKSLGRTVVFEAAGRKTPPALEAFYGPAREVLRREGLDVLGLEAIREYYAALYWRQGYGALDRGTLPGGEPLPIIPAIREMARKTNFPFERIARAFRLIEDAMDQVIVPYDDTAREAIRALTHAPLPPAGVRRTLQQYVVPVPGKARTALVLSGAVQAIRPDDYGDSFMILVAPRQGELPAIYDRELGIRTDRNPEARSAESNIFS